MTDMTKDAAHLRNVSATEADGVKCLLDDVFVHSIPAYLKVIHPDVTVAAYQAQFGEDTPLLSQTLIDARSRKAAAEAGVKINAATATVTRIHPEHLSSWEVAKAEQKKFAEVFDLGAVKAAQNKRGEPIMIEVLGDRDSAGTPLGFGDEIAAFVPDIDERYIFNIDLLKTVMMAFTLRKPLLAWGMHGTGKTTVIEQYCARTNRPTIRIQHTASTEEAHVLGQYVLKSGETVFEPGPLAIAMRYGLVYLADEYDFAMPNVTAVYQPVMEGKQLIIKEAPPEWRVVRPHPNFRFAATGNTNGAGDETGLYQGTQIQNAANYSRFGITVEVDYMPERQEIAVVASQGQIHADDAEKLVKIATAVRTAFRGSEIGVTISPRELINAAQLGRVLGGEWKQGLDLAYLNRLNTVDRKAVRDMAQRYLT